MQVPIIAIGISILALLYAVVLTSMILKRSTGDEKMREIAKSIQEGAMAYLNRQSITITAIAAIIFVAMIFVLPHGQHNDNILTAVSFLIGALFSAVAGYIGMNVSVRANVRTT